METANLPTEISHIIDLVLSNNKDAFCTISDRFLEGGTPCQSTASTAAAPA